MSLLPACLSCSDAVLQTAAARAVSNAASGGTASQVAFFAAHGCYRLLCQIVDSRGLAFGREVADGVEAYLRSGCGGKSDLEIATSLAGQVRRTYALPVGGRRRLAGRGVTAGGAVNLDVHSACVPPVLRRGSDGPPTTRLRRAAWDERSGCTSSTRPDLGEAIAARKDVPSVSGSACVDGLQTSRKKAKTTRWGTAPAADAAATRTPGLCELRSQSASPVRAHERAVQDGIAALYDDFGRVVGGVWACLLAADESAANVEDLVCAMSRPCVVSALRSCLRRRGYSAAAAPSQPAAVCPSIRGAGPTVVCGQTIAIDALIGGGKTAVIKWLSAVTTPTQARAFFPLPEPVDQLMPILAEFYRNPPGTALMLQTLFRLWFQLVGEFMQRTPLPPGCQYVVERTPLSGKIFVDNLAFTGVLDAGDLELYNRFEMAVQPWVPRVVYLLEQTAAVCHARMVGRGRSCEAGVTVALLESLHSRYTALYGALARVCHTGEPLVWGRSMTLLPATTVCIVPVGARTVAEVGQVIVDALDAQ